MLLPGEKLRAEGHLKGPPGDIGDLLREDQVHLPGRTVLQQAAPGGRGRHAGRRSALIDVKVHQRPVGTEGDSILELLFVVGEIAAVARLVELADIDADPIPSCGVGALVGNALEPRPVGGYPLLQSGLTCRRGQHGRLLSQAVHPVKNIR